MLIIETLLSTLHIHENNYTACEENQLPFCRVHQRLSRPVHRETVDKLQGQGVRGLGGVFRGDQTRGHYGLLPRLQSRRVVLSLLKQTEGNRDVTKNILRVASAVQDLPTERDLSCQLLTAGDVTRGIGQGGF